MIFPKGQAIYENLNTSFTQLEALLGELKNSRFTGYVLVSAWEYEGILLLEAGGVVDAIEETKNQRRSGPGAADSIANKSREKDGAISVYRLSDDMAQLLASLFNREPIYKDLSSDFTSLDKLLARLQSEKHTGCIDVHLTRSKGTASIFMRDGQTIESILSTNGSTVSGQKAMAQITQAATTEGAVFTVYRADLAEAYRNGVNLADSFARQGMLSLWQEVLTLVEKDVDGLSKPGTFLSAFKRACIEQATVYPFLDPFAAEFEYREGQIRFEGQATVAQFNQGLCQSMAHATHKLETEPRAKEISGKVRQTLNELKKKHGARLDEIGLTAGLPDFFAN